MSIYVSQALSISYPVTHPCNEFLLARARQFLEFLPARFLEFLLEQLSAELATQAGLLSSVASCITPCVRFDCLKVFELRFDVCSGFEPFGLLILVKVWCLEFQQEGDCRKTSDLGADNALFGKAS